MLKEIIDLKLLSQKLTSIKGVLVHGPAGIGKSHLIHSVIGPLNLKVIRVTPSHLISGDQFDKIKQAFKQSVESHILWFEEIDFIAKSKDKDLFYGFLEELD